jgi:hypothetical protein
MIMIETKIETKIEIKNLMNEEIIERIKKNVG